MLVVEDSIDNQVLVKAFLSDLHLHLDFAENGRVGVEMSKAFGYDLVLMDIQMPEMDDFEAVRHLRYDGFSGPVIAITSLCKNGDRERCLSGGFDDYLCKPFSRSSLAEAVTLRLSLSAVI